MAAASAPAMGESSCGGGFGTRGQEALPGHGVSGCLCTGRVG